MRQFTSLASGLIFCLLATTPAFGQSGEQLFVHQWVAEDSLSPGGDGLGPVFNGNSCVQCHHQGGTGGGGSIDQNLDFLTHTGDRMRAKQKLLKIHPGFQSRDGLARNTIILHRFSLDDEYSQIRKDLVRFDGAAVVSDRDRQRLQRAVAVQPVQPITLGKGVETVRTQRNSTALFGAGLIDSIPNRLLLVLASKHVPRSPMVSGRLSVLGMDSPGEVVRLGRFGWRGQTGSLSDFVTDACAFELGLELEARPQTPDPRNVRYRPPGVDLNRQQVDELTRYVAELPRPRQVLPDDETARQRVRHGEAMFMRLGCADCHIPQVGSIQQIYSDFLLHDMGSGLADPVAASRPVDLVTTRRSLGRVVQQPNPFAIGDNSSGGGAYGGGGSGSPKPAGKAVAGGTPRGSAAATLARVTSETMREWQTPPLWGVADSAPYLHDGRAATLVEAIAAHGGEASESVEACFTAPVQDQLALLEFLKTLRAPTAPNRP